MELGDNTQGSWARRVLVVDHAASPVTSAYETSNSLVDTAKMEFPSGRRGFFAD